MVNREHIYRCHQRPDVYCDRCLVSFTEEGKLAEHLRADNRCENKAAPSDGETIYITQSQERALRKRKRMVPEEERWLNSFQIIFPDVPKEHIPSPCKYQRVFEKSTT
jgi:hypothetical protein